MFIAIYAVEAILKLLFFGTQYFYDGWNIFDFIYLVCSIILLIVSTFVSLQEGIPSPIVACVRVAKLLCLFRMTKVLRTIFQTVTLALPAIANLALLFLIIIALFAAIGVYLFAATKLQSNLEQHANFMTFWSAFLTVFRMSTLDGWNGVMHDTMRQRAQFFECVDDPTYADIMANHGEPNGCGVVYAATYFLLLELMVTFVFLNLFVAIVVSSTLDITKLSESVLSDESLEKFQTVWKRHDPEVLWIVQDDGRRMALWSSRICGS